MCDGVRLFHMLVSLYMYLMNLSDIHCVCISSVCNLICLCISNAMCQTKGIPSDPLPNAMNTMNNINSLNAIAAGSGPGNSSVGVGVGVGEVGMGHTHSGGVGHTGGPGSLSASSMSASSLSASHAASHARMLLDARKKAYLNDPSCLTQASLQKCPTLCIRVCVCVFVCVCVCVSFSLSLYPNPESQKAHMKQQKADG